MWTCLNYAATGQLEVFGQDRAVRAGVRDHDKDVACPVQRSIQLRPGLLKV